MYPKSCFWVHIDQNKSMKSLFWVHIIVNGGYFPDFGYI